MRRRVLPIVVGTGLAAGIVAVLWGILGGPPARLLFRYGLPPAGGPTGRVVRIEGVEFLEFEPGYCRVGSHEGCDRGDFAGRVSSWLGLSWGTTPSHSGFDCPPRWVEIPHRFLIARKRITRGEYWRLHRPEGSVLRELEGTKLCMRRKAEDWCDRLAGRARRAVRLPDRRELEFVRGHLGPPATLERWELRRWIRYEREWIRDEPTELKERTFRPVSTALAPIRE